MRHYVLYIKKCPGVDDPKDFKIGVAALEHARSRLATYQNAVGPVYTEQFERIWLGDSVDVKEAEKKIKSHFRHRIYSSEAGLSEWLCDTTFAEILFFIRELREEYFIKLIDAPEELQPLTMPLCEDLQAWYEDYLTVK
jgi:hypothetical protein